MTPPTTPKSAHDEFKRGYKAAFSRVNRERESAPWDQKSANRHFRAGVVSMIAEDMDRHSQSTPCLAPNRTFTLGYKLNPKVMHEAWLAHARENRLNSRSLVTKGVGDDEGGELDAQEEMIYDVSRQAVRAELAACGLLKALEEDTAVDVGALIQEAEKLRDTKQVSVDGLADALYERNSGRGVQAATADRLQSGIEAARRVIH